VRTATTARTRPRPGRTPRCARRRDDARAPLMRKNSLIPVTIVLVLASLLAGCGTSGPQSASSRKRHAQHVASGTGTSSHPQTSASPSLVAPSTTTTFTAATTIAPTTISSTTATFPTICWRADWRRRARPTNGHRARSDVCHNTYQYVPCGQSPPFGGGSESLWTETTAYRRFAVVQYNTTPVVPGAGSAIFIHADVGSATDGCVTCRSTSSTCYCGGRT